MSRAGHICFGMLLSIVIGGCGASHARRAEPRTAVDSSSDPIVTFSRWSCHGHCPIYKVEIHADGRFVHDGDAYVKVKGRCQSRLTKDEMQALHAAFARARFAELPMRTLEKQHATGHSSVMISRIDPTDGAHHFVWHDLSNRDAPQSLLVLEAEIDSIVHIEQWIGTREERERSTWSGKRAWTLTERCPRPPPLRSPRSGDRG